MTFALPADRATSPLVSVIVVATDEAHHLHDCLPSLAALAGPTTDVMVIDNASTDGTREFLAAAFPWVNVVRTGQRLGYAAANNLGFRHARGSYLVVLNPDTRVHPDFVSALVETSRRYHDRVLVTSRICLFDDPATINACGNLVQFGMLASCRGLGDPVHAHASETYVPAISGCAFLIHRSVLDALGGFDERIYPYLEDTELSLRAWGAGFSCVLAPESRVFHKYQFRITPKKLFSIERNRWLVMYRCYRLRTILCLLPALILIEFLAWGYAASLGRRYAAAKARSYVALGLMSKGIWMNRRESRQRRRIADRLLLEHMSAEAPVAQLVAARSLQAGVLRVANAGLKRYFTLVQGIVRW